MQLDQYGQNSALGLAGFDPGINARVGLGKKKMGMEGLNL
jgi:hypothetical protein